MTDGHTEHLEIDSFERRTRRAYRREMIPAIVVYVVAVFALMLFVDFDTAGDWKYLVVLVPLIPALLGIRAVERHLMRMDELQRSIQLSAIAAGFTVAMALALMTGFFALAGLDTTNAPWLIFTAGMASWFGNSQRAAQQHG